MKEKMCNGWVGPSRVQVGGHVTLRDSCVASSLGAGMHAVKSYATAGLGTTVHPNTTSSRKLPTAIAHLPAAIPSCQPPCPSRSHLHQEAGRLRDALDGCLRLLRPAAPLSAHVCHPAAQLGQPRLQGLRGSEVGETGAVGRAFSSKSACGQAQGCAQASRQVAEDQLSQSISQARRQACAKLPTLAAETEQQSRRSSSALSSSASMKLRGAKGQEDGKPCCGWRKATQQSQDQVHPAV